MLPKVQVLELYNQVKVLLEEYDVSNLMLLPWLIALVAFLILLIAVVKLVTYVTRGFIALFTLFSNLVTTLFLIVKGCFNACAYLISSIFIGFNKLLRGIIGKFKGRETVATETPLRTVERPRVEVQVREDRQAPEQPGLQDHSPRGEDRPRIIAQSKKPLKIYLNAIARVGLGVYFALNYLV